jgi:hypothetical protein
MSFRVRPARSDDFQGIYRLAKLTGAQQSSIYAFAPIPLLNKVLLSSSIRSFVAIRNRIRVKDA